MTEPVPSTVQATYPPNNALRIGKATVDSDGLLQVSVQEEIVNCGFLDTTGALVVGDPVALLRGEASWLALGRVSSRPTVPRIATTVATSSVGPFTALTEVMSVTGNLLAGCTYKVAAYYHVASTAANDLITARLRPDNIASADIQLDFNVLITSTGGVASYIEVEYTATVNETKTFVLGIQRATGAGNISLTVAATFPSYMYIDFVRSS
jgi:hypothetical protein